MPALTPLAEVSKAATALAELVSTAAYSDPALYPSALKTFPSSRTFPSSGTFHAAVGLNLIPSVEGSNTLTATAEGSKTMTATAEGSKTLTALPEV